MWYYIVINFMAFCRLEAEMLPHNSVSGSRAAKFDARRRQPRQRLPIFGQKTKQQRGSSAFTLQAARGKTRQR